MCTAIIIITDPWVNGIEIGSAFFAALTSVPDTHRHTETDRQTDLDHITYDVCSNRPHLRDACNSAMWHNKMQSVLKFCHLFGLCENAK